MSQVEISREEIARFDIRLASVLPPEALYAVGGRVRDEMRGDLAGAPFPIKDLDYVVVGVPLDELLSRLRAVGRAELAGASFSVIKTTIGTTTADVALPRRERSTGVGHRDFVIESGPHIPLEEDLARRDFRMNMMARAIRTDSARESRDLVDPYNGAEDVRRRRIDLLRQEAFVEDPLRMLRAVQFAARFAYEITSSTRRALCASSPLIASVSQERVRDECIKLLSAERPSVGFEIMRETGLLAHVMPELLEGYGVEQNAWHAYDVYRHNLETLDAASSEDLTLRLAALLHDIAKPQTKDGPHFYRHEIVGTKMATEILERLRFPVEAVRTVAGLVHEHMYTADPAMSPAALRRFVRRVGVENVGRQFALRHADICGSGLPKRDDTNAQFEERVAAIMAERPAFSVKDLAVGGSDVILALVEVGRLPPGSHGGPLVGRVLQALFELVTDDPRCNERDQLLLLMSQVIDGVG
jgi:poly(A) polymerase/tRNA nucleotidyltransferase (CCA-adding enzyme)